jgi:hypothetical protein
MHLDVQSLFLVPTLLLGIPDDERLMLRLPTGVEFKELLLRGSSTEATKEEHQRQQNNACTFEPLHTLHSFLI